MIYYLFISNNIYIYVHIFILNFLFGVENNESCLLYKKLYLKFIFSIILIFLIL